LGVSVRDALKIPKNEIVTKGKKGGEIIGVKQIRWQ